MKTNNKSEVTATVEVLQLIFIVLKLVKVIDWSWWWVLSPTIITTVIIILIYLAIRARH